MVVDGGCGPKMFFEPSPKSSARCLLYIPNVCILLIPKHPKLPVSVAPALVSTHIYLGSLTFSLKPDEVALVWRQQKLVFNKCE